MRRLLAPLLVSGAAAAAAAATEGPRAGGRRRGPSGRRAEGDAAGTERLGSDGRGDDHRCSTPTSSTGRARRYSPETPRVAESLSDLSGGTSHTPLFNNYREAPPGASRSSSAHRIRSLRRVQARLTRARAVPSAAADIGVRRPLSPTSSPVPGSSFRHASGAPRRSDAKTFGVRAQLAHAGPRLES